MLSALEELARMSGIDSYFCFVLISVCLSALATRSLFVLRRVLRGGTLNVRRIEIPLLCFALKTKKTSTLSRVGVKCTSNLFHGRLTEVRVMGGRRETTSR